jgi:transcriptional regulator with XRE-family HTH domain
MPEAGASPFGAELRAHRKKHALTQKELAEKLGWSESYISDVERGDRGVRSDFALKCDHLFESPGTFGRILQQMRRNAYPAFFAPVVPYEQDAARIHGWELGAIPGLLQTAEYARAVTRARSPRDDDEAIEAKVTARMQRQEILIGPDNPLLWLVIHEGAVRHIVGSPEIMARQLDKLAEAAESPGVVIQILPLTAHDFAGGEGPIYVYEAAGGTTVAYTECFGGGRIVENPDEVVDLVTVVGMLRAVALPPRESLALIKEIKRGIDELP